MLKIEHKINYELKFDVPFNLEKSVFIDIETTGLSREFSFIYLIGIVKYNLSEGFHMTQLFIDAAKDEKSLLLAFKSEVKDCLLLTYNGDSFDIPFINSRINKYNDIQLSNESFDIMKYLKKFKHFLTLENYKLKTLEKHLNIHREDIYSGKDCSQFYKEYQYTKDPDLLNKILQHNYDDIYSMPKLLGIIPHIDGLRTIESGDTKLIIKDIFLDKDMLKISGNLKGPCSKLYNYYGSNHHLSIEEKKFTVSIETRKAHIDDSTYCNYIITSDFNFKNGIIDQTIYKLPENLIILFINNLPIIDNIKNVLNEIIKIGI